MKQTKKILQSHHVNNGEFYLSEYIVMVIVGDNVTCIGNNSTVNKFIVIWIGCDEIETILGREKSYISALNKVFKHIISSFLSRESGQDFCIFLKNLVSDTKGISSINDRQPNLVVDASRRYALNKTVCVEDYSHLLKCFLFFCLFFSEPLVQVHLVYFVKPFLVKDALVPQFLQMAVKAFSIIVTNEILYIVKLFLIIDMRKHAKQIKLGFIKHGGMYSIHNYNNLDSCVQS